MVSTIETITPQVLNNHISVQVAASYSGYNLQYIRRLLRNGRLPGLKIGQVWPIDKTAFEAYLDSAVQVINRRFGPKKTIFHNG